MGDGGPEVEFLADEGGVTVVVAVERCKSSEGGPARAELFVGVVCKTTDVGSDHGDLVDGCEGEHATDGHAVVEPCT